MRRRAVRPWRMDGAINTTVRHHSPKHHAPVGRPAMDRLADGGQTHRYAGASQLALPAMTSMKELFLLLDNCVVKYINVADTPLRTSPRMALMGLTGLRVALE